VSEVGEVSEVSEVSEAVMDAIRFRATYDVARLQAELAGVVAGARWIAKPERGKYVGWSSIPLHSQYGAMSDEAVDVHIPAALAGECGPTPVLGECPYVGELLAGFAAARLRVRFMRLAAGGRIGRHTDRQYGWRLPILRLHLPVVTDENVEFVLAGRRIELRPGELWYLDTTREHEVFNRGVHDRVHLVIDLVNGPGLRAQLGPQTWAVTLPARG